MSAKFNQVNDTPNGVYSDYFKFTAIISGLHTDVLLHSSLRGLRGLRAF